MIKAEADYGLLLEHLALYAQAKTIVEIGVARGDTTASLCRGAAKVGGHVYGFDLWETHGVWNQFERFATRDEVEAKLKEKGHSNFTLTKINSASPEFPATLAKICPSIDLAFIDGDHSYTGLKIDFDAVYPLMSGTGIVAFHDTLRIDGCREFVLDLRTKFNDGTYDIVDLPWGVWPNGQRDGMTLLVKRSFPLFPEIGEICSSPSTPQEIVRREREWYQGQVRATDRATAPKYDPTAPAAANNNKLAMFRWKLGRKLSLLAAKIGGA
jgi:predicted O-methyltransferase YrrM